MSLEVDRRNELPIGYQKHDSYKYAISSVYQEAPHTSLAFEQHQQGRWICGLRPGTLMLSIALNIMIVLAIVAAGVGGSLAVENKNVCVS